MRKTSRTLVLASASPRRVESLRQAGIACRVRPAEVDEYVASGEPFDKAGACAIQGRASKFVERIEGCYFNVVGLPVARVYELLSGFDDSPGSAAPNIDASPGRGRASARPNNFRKFAEIFSPAWCKFAGTRNHQKSLDSQPDRRCNYGCPGILS